ncbi:MAG: tetratricopeptide repeat protein [Chlamydiia bacterium]|nr:tetratricopeptide repeat protein [Chlamydiia bacterium]
MDDAIERFVNVLMAYVPLSDYEGVQAKKQRLMAQMGDHTKTYRQRFYKGVQLLQIETPSLDEKHVEMCLKQGKSLQQALQLSDNEMDEGYQRAREIYERKNYEEAADAFVVLATLNPDLFGHWFGLGASEYMLKHYSQAIWALGFAAMIDPEDVAVHTLIGRAYEALGDESNAQAAFSIIKKLKE